MALGCVVRCVIILNNSPTVINAGNVGRALFIGPGNAPSVPANAFLVCVFMKDLDIPGFVSVEVDDVGAYSKLCMQYWEDSANKTFNAKCGPLVVGGAADIPVKYLPEDCNTSVW